MTIYYERHENGKKIEEEMDVLEFIKKVIIHIPEKQFKMVRYYGIYANHTKKRPYLIKMVDEKIIELKKKYKAWRYRIMKSFGQDPLNCPNCNKTMEMIDIYYPKYGSMLERFRQREYEKTKKQIDEVKEIYSSVKDIPRDVVEMLDLQDGGDLSVPPRFDCEVCNGLMKPIHYRSVHEITYNIDEE